MNGPDINRDIAERIMRWQVHQERRLYREGIDDSGNLRKLPDFVASQRANDLLRRRMEEMGFSLNVVHNALDWDKKTGQTFTARFTRHSQTFESTQGDENHAVCCAALRAVEFTYSSPPRGAEVAS